MGSHPDHLFQEFSFRKEKVDLNHSDITDQDTVLIARFLTENTPLQTLDLSGNAISDQGAKNLAKALIFNYQLTGLDLRWNKITAEGADYLRWALQTNYALQSLEIGGNFNPDLANIKISELIRRHLLENSTNRHKKALKSEWRKKTFHVLLCARIDPHSYFYKDIFPLDLFKYILPFCKLHKHLFHFSRRGSPLDPQPREESDLMQI